ncbi:hypothetical protein D3C81_2086900 [compost metagenome]
MNAEHTFSHIHWNLRVFRFQEATGLPGLNNMAAEAKIRYETSAAFAEGSDDVIQQYRWIRREDMAGLAFPNVFLKILNEYYTNCR